MENLLAVLDETAYIAFDEFVQKLYVKNEKDNQYYLKLSGDEAAKLATPLQKEVDRLKKHNETVLGEKKTFQDKLKTFESLGKSPEEIIEFYEKNGNLDIEALKKSYREEVEGVQNSSKEQISEAEKERNDAFNQLQSYVTRTTVAELKAKYDLNDLADDVLGNRIRTVPEAEGASQFVVRVFENGDVAYKAGSFKTPEQLVEEMRVDKRFHGMFNAGTGGGTGGTNRQTNFIGNQNLEGLSPTEKLKIARQQV